MLRRFDVVSTQAAVSFKILGVSLSLAGGDCDLVCPPSSSWGYFEGIWVLRHTVQDSRFFHFCLCTGGDCDLVCPLSTVAGLGSWGSVEGIEVLFGLSPPARQFVQNPLNFRRVQVRQTRSPTTSESPSTVQRCWRWHRQPAAGNHCVHSSPAAVPALCQTLSELYNLV